MATYTPRLTAPSSNNKNFLHYAKSKIGGYNYCIHIAGGSCIPNCVGYAWGRWRELLGKKPELSRANAENWYSYTSDGYKRGQTPKLGAVICWRKGQAGNSSDGAGHVAIVEKISANGDITTSESAYGGVRFKVRTYKKSDNYYLAKGYYFQGFIYPPVDFEEKKPKYKTGSYIVTADVLNVRTGAGTTYRKKTYTELTSNAQEQIQKLSGTKANGYVKGVKFTVTEVKDNWGKTRSGWVCLDYAKKV